MDRYRYVVPVCCDALGQTWLGFAETGAEVGRPVMLTICPHEPESLVGRHLIESAVGSLSVRHPNALAFLEVAHSEAEVVLVGEHLEGQPLAALLRASANDQRPIPPHVALTIIKEAVNTLVALNEEHPNAVEHGGFCPDAIFVATYGETMLRQPGIVSAGMKLPNLRRHPSSLPYQAPEFLRDARENEESADVFSAGVMLWEMLVGRPLFGGRDHKTFGRLATLLPSEVKQVEQRILNGRVPSLVGTQIAGGVVHGDLARLVDWALQRDPAARPQTLEDLSRALASLPAQLHASSAEVAATVRTLAGRRMAERSRRLNRELHRWRDASAPSSRRPSMKMPVPNSLELDAPDSVDKGLDDLPFQTVDPPRTLDAPQLELDSPSLPPDVRKRLPSGPNLESLIPAPIPERKIPEAPQELPSLEVKSRPVPPRPVAADLPHLTRSQSSIPPEQGRRTTPLMWLAAAVMLFSAGAGSSYALFSFQSSAAPTAQAEPVRSTPAALPAPGSATVSATGTGSGALPPAPIEAEPEPVNADPDAVDEPEAHAEPAVLPKRSPVVRRSAPAAAAPSKDHDAPFRPTGL